MKATVLSVLSTLALSVKAQDFNQSAAFTLTINSDDASIDGQLLNSCHNGAALETLCLLGTTTSAASTTFYLNSTEYQTYLGLPVGPLIWNLPYNTDQVESEPMTLTSSPSTNVLVPQFSPQDSVYQTVGFDAESKLFLLDTSYDDSKFVAGVIPAPSVSKALYNWYACYTDTYGYYYHTLAWVSYGVPRNPTCSPVNVTRTYI
jgi:hypothetical protein